MSSDRPPAKGEPNTHWNDQKTPGLTLRFWKDGKASWYLFYRTKSGTKRNMKIGDSASFTLTAARERALKIRRDVAEGKDPALEFKLQTGLKTMQDLRDFHIETHVKIKLKPDAERVAVRLWDTIILKSIKPKTLVRDVVEADVSKLHHSQRATPTQGNRVVALLSKAMNLAEDEGWRSRNTNPVQVERFPERKRRRKPERDEPLRLMLAMEQMRKRQPAFIGFVELVALTGARASEILKSRLEWVFEDGLRLPDAKNGEKLLALPSFARDVIIEIPRLKGNPWIIPGRRPGMPMRSYAKRWAALLKLAKIENLHLHDLRRFFASAGLSSGESLSAIGQVLGHTQAQTTMRYAFLMTDAQQATAEVAATRVRQLMTNNGKVVVLGRT